MTLGELMSRKLLGHRYGSHQAIGMEAIRPSVWKPSGHRYGSHQAIGMEAIRPSVWKSLGHQYDSHRAVSTEVIGYRCNPWRWYRGKEREYI
jgi:hypothetical protein